MFDDDKQTDQTNNINNDLGIGSAPTIGIGASPTQTPDPATPAVVLPNDPDVPAAPTPTPASDPHSHPAASKLEDIKREALTQLSPLVGKLDQSPEDKYKTLIMMIQATDNEELIPEAYENAQKISDETFKAEALLSIVNEINYFAQKNK